MILQLRFHGFCANGIGRLTLSGSWLVTNSASSYLEAMTSSCCSEFDCEEPFLAQLCVTTSLWKNCLYGPKPVPTKLWEINGPVPAQSIKLTGDESSPIVHFVLKSLSTLERSENSQCTIRLRRRFYSVDDRACLLSFFLLASDCFLTSEPNFACSVVHLPFPGTA